MVGWKKSSTNVTEPHHPPPKKKKNHHCVFLHCKADSVSLLFLHWSECGNLILKAKNVDMRAIAKHVVDKC